MSRMRNQRGAFTVEAAVAFTVIIGGLVFMLGYLQRGMQGGVKGNADSMGQQFSATTSFSNFSKQMSRTDNTQSQSTSCSNYEQILGGNSTLNAAACDQMATPTGWQ